MVLDRALRSFLLLFEWCHCCTVSLGRVLTFRKFRVGLFESAPRDAAWCCCCCCCCCCCLISTLRSAWKWIESNRIQRCCLGFFSFLFFFAVRDRCVSASLWEAEEAEEEEEEEATQMSIIPLTTTIIICNRNQIIITKKAPPLLPPPPLLLLLLLSAVEEEEEEEEVKEELRWVKVNNDPHICRFRPTVITIPILPTGPSSIAMTTTTIYRKKVRRTSFSHNPPPRHRMATMKRCRCQFDCRWSRSIKPSERTWKEWSIAAKEKKIYTFKKETTASWSERWTEGQLKNDFQIIIIFFFFLFFSLWWFDCRETGSADSTQR